MLSGDDDILTLCFFTFIVNDTIEPDTTMTMAQGNISGQCQQGFFFDQNETEMCRPECGEFMLSPLASVVLSRLSYFIGLVASVVMFILAIMLHRKKL